MEPDLPKYSLLIAQFPGNNQTHPDPALWVAENVVRIERDPRIKGLSVISRSDTPITMVRNLVTQTAIEQGFDYLLMIDSDMKPDLYFPMAPRFWDSSWAFMMRFRDENPDVPATIASPYCGPPPDELPYIFRWTTRQSDHPNPDYKLEMVSRNEAAMSRGIEPVDALPTGLILYDLRVFAKLPKPWFDYEHGPDWTKKDSTEDVYQTRNAALCGFPQFVNWDCWSGHWKLKCVGKPQVLTSSAMAPKLAEAMTREPGTVRTYIMPDHLSKYVHRCGLPIAKPET